MLKRVILTKNDTCLTYVIKRTGIETNLKFTVDIPDDLLLSFNGDFTKLKVGDIIGWKANRKIALLRNEISSIGGKPVVIHNPVYVHIHLAVVEQIEEIKSNTIITISDCVRKENVNSVPEIRLKVLNLRGDEPKETEVRLPDFILNVSKLKEI